jgi:hypothetical protein
MVVTRLEGKISLTVRGPETKATMADCPARGEWFGVLFKLGTFMRLMRSSDLRDRNDVTLPLAELCPDWNKRTQKPPFRSVYNPQAYPIRPNESGQDLCRTTEVGSQHQS